MLETAIIGAGPAGIAAAVQIKRMGHEPVLFEKARVGGLLVNAHLVENYPGFPEGIPGRDLVRLMEAHLARHSISIRFEEVLRAEARGGRFVLRTPREELSARALVVASGTRHLTTRPAELPEIPAGLGARVLTEIHPLRDAAGKRVAIIGAGDAAFDYALSLGARNEVVIICRSLSPKCIPVLLSRVCRCKTIRHLPETAVTEIESGGQTLRLTCVGPRGSVAIEAEYLVLAMGREPELSFLDPRLAGLARRNRGRQRIHFAGDVVRGGFRQTAIAVGDGVAAAMCLHKELVGSGR